MVRQPATLSSFAIFNPTLKPPELPEQEDDEDAEQQAQILFYTSKERAVSNNTMLRQVGLAQALINFSQKFSAVPHEHQEVHSQTSRMIMVSPEPNYWLYVGIDVARAPKARNGDAKGKGKAEDPASVTPNFDYHDASLKDTALRSYLQSGYDEFKLLYGPFSMIFEKEGRQALENRLEKFFAVWVWQWDIETSCSHFGYHLTQVVMHPRYSNIASILESKDSPLSKYPDLTVLLLESSFMLHPRTKTHADSLNPQPVATESFPPSLPLYLLKLIPPARPPPGRRKNPRIQDLSTADEGGTSFGTLSRSRTKSTLKASSMDPRRWNLGSYLALPASWAGTKEVKDTPAVEPPSEKHSEKEAPSEGLINNESSGNGCAEINVQEASSPASSGTATIEGLPETSTTEGGGPLSRSQATIVAGDPSRAISNTHMMVLRNHQSNAHLRTASTASSSAAASETSSITSEFSYSFKHLRLHLPSKMTGASEIIMRRKVWYIIAHRIVFAAIPPLESEDELPEGLSESVENMLGQIRQALDADDEGLTTGQSTRRLIKNKHGITADHPLGSYSQHLFDSSKLLHHPEVYEVISRPLNAAQPWIASRRLGDDVSEMEEVHLEMMRADTTLIDVDRELSTGCTST